MIEYIQTLIEKNIFNDVIELLQENEFGFMEDIDNIHVRYVYISKEIIIKDIEKQIIIYYYYSNNEIGIYKFDLYSHTVTECKRICLSQLENVSELTDEEWFMFNINNDTKNYPRELFEYCVKIYNLLK